MFTILLLITALTLVSGDDVVGYYVASDSTEAVVAKCSYEPTASQRWSTAGSMGVCVETNDDKTQGTKTTNYYVGASCVAESARGNYLAIADERSATVTLNFRCYPSCATITIFDASPSVGPSASFIGCPYQIGLPEEARTVYRKLPSGVSVEPGSNQESTATSTSSSAKSTSNSSGSSTQVTDAPNSEDGKNAPDGISKDKDSDTPVIVGAVVGSVGGVALIVIAFFLGRRLAARKRSEKTADVQQQYYNQGKPELGGTEVGPVAGTTPGFWDQVAWQQGQQHGQHHGQVWQASELPSKYPAAHQMSSGMGPYEVGSNSGDGNYPGHTATYGVMK